jgi:hypothetical protein
MESYPWQQSNDYGHVSYRQLPARCSSEAEMKPAHQPGQTRQTLRQERRLA